MGGYVGRTFSYTPVEYIESSGTQYIDTGIVPKSTTRMVLECSQITTTTGITMGWSSSGSQEAFMVSADTTNQVYAGYCSSNYTKTLSNVPLDTNKHTFDISNNAIKVDGTSFGTGTIGNTATTGQTLYIFSLHSEWSPYINNASVKIYSCKFYDGDTLVRDYAPALDLNNVACLYEKVSGKFVYNQGTGTFTYGTVGTPVIIGGKARKLKLGYVGVNSSYTPVEYIESSGTQYIDTGVSSKPTTKLEFDANIVSGDANVWLGLWGARTSASDDFFCLYVQTSSPHYLSVNYAGFDPGTSGNTPINFNQRYLLTQDKGQFYIDGVKATGLSTTNTLTAGTQPIYLFTNNTFGTPQMRGQDIKLYGCRITDGDTLVRDFIPVIDQDGVACLYEQVEGRFYYNKGTGSFTAGSATGSSIPTGGKARKIQKGYVGIPTSYTPVEYIESSGTQYVDTGVVRDITKKFRFVASVKWNDIQTRQCIGAQGFVYFGVSGGKYQIAQGGTTTTNINATTSSFENIDLTFNCPSNTCTGTVNNTSTGTISVPYQNSPENAHIHLFSLNDLVLPCSVQIASFQIYENDVLVRDFIPVVNQDNVACMYELVEGTYYYNKGTGSFTAGSTTGSSVSTGGMARLCYAAFDYGDGTNNNVSNGYVNKIYLNGVYTPSSGGTYFKGNYDLDPDPTNSQYTVIFNTIRVNADYNSIMNQSNHVSWLYGSNTIAVNIDATSEDKTCMINWRGNGRLASYCYYDNLKFSVGGTYMTLQQMVASKIIKPLVLISSSHNNSDSRMLYSNILNMYTGGQTDSKFYSNVSICFMLNKGYTIGNMQFYASASHNVTGVATGDGLGWAYCPTSKANLTLNEY